MSQDRQALAAGSAAFLGAAALGALFLFEAAWLQPGDRPWIAWFGYAFWYAAPLIGGPSWGYLTTRPSAAPSLALGALAAVVSLGLNTAGFTIGVMAVPIYNLPVVLGLAVVSVGLLMWLGA